jgi:hypothetical protein
MATTSREVHSDTTETLKEGNEIPIQQTKIFMS